MKKIIKNLVMPLSLCVPLSFPLVSSASFTDSGSALYGTAKSAEYDSSTISGSESAYRALDASTTAPVLTAIRLITE